MTLPSTDGQVLEQQPQHCPAEHSTAPKPPVCTWVQLCTSCWGGRSRQQGGCSHGQTRNILWCSPSPDIPPVDTSSFIKASWTVSVCECNQNQTQGSYGKNNMSRTALNHSVCWLKWNQDLEICTETERMSCLRQRTGGDVFKGPWHCPRDEKTTIETVCPGRGNST